ncbi:Aldo-ket-red domain-containing protein [Aphelenchoides besseyi]|nr:Aldo-ket-red domain-containing protein [Aphelenchoides besseyi]
MFHAIGVSDFSPKQIQSLYNVVEIKPHNLQVELRMAFTEYDNSLIVRHSTQLKIARFDETQEEFRLFVQPAGTGHPGYPFEEGN